MTELAFASATAALTAFRALEMSPLDVLEAQISEIERRNGDSATGVNALTETLFDSARSAARSAAERYARCAADGETPPALLGLTVATKEKQDRKSVV